jgi:hypothetical protein
MPATRETPLGPPATQARRPSAISQALKAIQGDLERLAPKWRFCDAQGTRFRIFIARGRNALGRAERLVHRMYVQRGYASGRPSEQEQAPRALGSNTLTLLAEDASGREAGTVSLVFDGPEGLPSDEIYRSELDDLRAKGRRLVEVTRLAIHDRHAKSKGLLVQLFNFISIYARRLRHDTDFVVSVNPRHTAFYRRLLAFKVAGPERPCPRVQNAPAVLLSLDLSIGHPENRERWDRDLSRTLYPHFSSLEEENVIVGFFLKALARGSKAEKEGALFATRHSHIHPDASRGSSS